jgi:hypothetical protein
VGLRQDCCSRRCLRGATFPISVLSTFAGHGPEQSPGIGHQASEIAAVRLNSDPRSLTPEAGTPFAVLIIHQTIGVPKRETPRANGTIGVMKHKNSHLLVGYWSRLRKGRAVPDQTDIDPRAIKRMLSSVFILDVESSPRPIYRLAGTALCERFGFELRGTGFLAHWDAQSATAVASLLRQALKLRQPVCLSSMGATGSAGMVEMETLLAPVSFNGGEPNRFIGLIQVLSDQALLAGKPIAFQRLVASQLIREDDPLPAFDSLPPPSTPPDALRTHPRAPHLRLVASQTKPATVHFADEDMRKLLDGCENGMTKLRPA